MSVKKRLGDLLLSMRLVTLEQLDHAVRVQQEAPAPLGRVLVGLGYLEEDLLLNVLALQHGVRPWRLNEMPPDPEAVEKLPAHLCHTHRVLPVAIHDDLLLVAMADPQDLDAIELIRNATKMRIEPVYADPERLDLAISRTFSIAAANEAIDGMIDQALRDFRVENSSRRQATALTDEDTRPVVGLVNQILSDAIRLGASDIHLEPRPNRVDVRYRVDGELRMVRELPDSLMPMLTTRLKIMAELDIVEFRVPQDGRVSVTIDGRHIDLRVSVLPNYHGPRIVLRILDKSTALKRLPEIGFNDRNLSVFQSLVSKPYGMFLVTGPTGSGKTTTLYAALQELKSEKSNIMTCEDPVEYDLDGVNQSQVNEKVGLTFARQLRAILRQDPDVVLVGEIRDGETAETAIRASMTGHLVLSTLHSNDAPSAIPRLLDMKVNPYLLSTSLIGVMAQRLLRVLCPDCKRATQPNGRTMDRVAERVPGHTTTTYEPVGCAACGGTGYRGRMPVHELMPVSGDIAQLIAHQGTTDEIREAARAHGLRTMQEEAIDLVLSGVTSMAEAERVVFFDDYERAPTIRLAA